ncbi:hypothetical protein [Pyrococcus yayanosii]|uniref:Uncharacterized protein n=1 Tax=Pyrococcus yayanosii (strain CH1 / JCM 16557) TaxID=529709 RepID=F8AIX8_PYRYC|nr:hypothetical protein [Pyrococcus yayanosii]AEH24453.1 hypothetical protein PYCH_07660 [Pyrococcus yayanosii CH1]
MEKLSRKEILKSVLMEGLYWAYLGRPKEVMPFLRGKLRALSAGSQELVDELLREIELFYEEVSRMESVGERELRRLKFYFEMLVSLLGL